MSAILNHAHSAFCCFLCSLILFQILYFNSNCSVSFFIIISTRDSLHFVINPISSFKFSSKCFGKSKLKQKVLGSLVTIIFSSIIIITSLNCCKLFEQLYYADKKDIALFALFHFLIYMNYFQPLFALIILKV